MGHGSRGKGQGGRQILNPNIEILNKFESPMFKTEPFEVGAVQPTLDFGNLILFRISIFDIGI